MDMENPITRTSNRSSQGLFSHRGLRKARAADTVITGLGGSAGIAEIFPGVWRGLPTFNYRSTWRTWVYSIAKNCIADSRKKLARNREVFQEIKETEPQVQMNLLGTVPDPRPEPDILYNQEEERLLYERALPYLEKDERAILLMYYTYEDPMSKIADVLGIPLSTAYKRKDAAEEKCIKIIKWLTRGNTSESA
jgi:RNA polymerase sigma-70 factor, ECF subfamily